MEPISALLQSPVLLRLAGPMLAVLLIVFFWWRSGSLHSLFERIWRLAAGKADAHDPRLRNFIQEMRDLERFRFIYGLKVETRAEMQRLLQWLREHSIGISVAQRARRWIDIKSKEIIKTPSKKYFIVHVCSAIVCAFLAVACIEFSLYESALLQSKASKTWFVSDGNLVRGVTSDWAVDARTCAEDQGSTLRNAGFSGAEADLLCRGLKDDALQRVVKEAVRQQQAIGFVTSIVFLLSIASAFVALSSAAAAMTIVRTTALPKPSD